MFRARHEEGNALGLEGDGVVIGACQAEVRRIRLVETKWFMRVSAKWLFLAERVVRLSRAL